MSTCLSVNEPMIRCQAGLNQTELEHKIRLLTLASLTSPQVGKAVPYAQIAGALQVPERDVEKWVIQGTWESGMLSGTLLMRV